jgi:hypothetical protein
MTLRTAFAAAVLALALWGCSKPVPAEKSAYVGEWKSPAMYLLITPDGSVKYVRLKDGVKTTVTGPLLKFEGDDFDVGVAFLSTRFVVSKAPAQANGTWKMVVDGEELTRKQRAITY